MSLTTLPWIVGGWFILAALAGPLIGRMVALDRRAELPDEADMPVPAACPAEQNAQPSMVA